MTSGYLWESVFAWCPKSLTFLHNISDDDDSDKDIDGNQDAEEGIAVEISHKKAFLAIHFFT